MNVHGCPDFCLKCWKFEECEQKENMLAGTEPVFGYVDTGAGEHVCSDCAGSRSNLYPLDQCEIDSPAHCVDCGAPLSHSLTPEGVDYVKAQLADGDGCCRELWPTVWADELNW